MVIHPNCYTKKECGCWYGCCVQCDDYTTKDKQGNIHFYKWDGKTHIEVGIYDS